MGLFDTIFGNKEEQKNFVQGDVFYSKLEGRFHLFKLLRHDELTKTFHVLCYEPLDELPGKHDLHNLDVMVYHSPIADDGFTDTNLFMHSAVGEHELIGYLEYLKHTDYRKYIDEIGEKGIAKANALFTEACALSDAKQHRQAIEKYSEIIELLPTYYEAIDNRAFCKMDLGKWEDAIADFKLSMEINPVSVLAEFSIGECYLKMAKLESAKTQFEKALSIKPDDELSKKFLAKTVELMRAGN
jgi:tetratricopeptide (TPR) repeat protein